MRAAIFFCIQMLLLVFSFSSSAQQKSILELIAEGQYPYEHQQAYFNTDTVSQHLIHSVRSFSVPKLFSSYYYPRARKDWMGDWSFFVSEVVKNYGLPNWNLGKHTSHLKLYFKDSISQNLHFGKRVGESKKEGFISYGRNNVSMKEWNPFDPHLYGLEVVSFSSPSPSTIAQRFKKVIGIREIKSEGRKLLIGEEDLLKRIVAVEQLNSRKQVCELKSHHVSAVLVRLPVSHDLLAICDSLGLPIIQKIDHENFSNATDFFAKYLYQYTHPSLVAWSVGKGFQFREMLQDLDPARPLIDISNHSVLFYDGLTESGKEALKCSWQPFNFSYTPEDLTIEVSQTNAFYDIELKISWEILTDRMTTFVAKDPFIKSVDDYQLLAYPFLGNFYLLNISLISNENKYCYSLGDHVASIQYFVLKTGNDTWEVKTLPTPF